MPALTVWIRRLRVLLRRDAVERAMDDEMRHHLECETAERIAAGMSPDAARRSATRDFGGVERFKEEARDARGTRPIEDVGRDVRYAARILRRSPGYTASVILTFALGVGATTSIFSVVYGVVLRPLPYADPGRLVAVWERDVVRNVDRNVVSLDAFEAWRDRTNAFAGMAALVPRTITLPGAAGPDRIACAEVSAGYFGLLGIHPALGRDFLRGDANAVILSDALWRQRFDGDPAVIGRSLTIAGTAYTVVGVMPARFDPPRLGWLGEQQAWFPFVATGQTRAWGRFLLVIGRLNPGATIDGARSEVIAVSSQRERESSSNRGWSASVVPLRDQIAGDARTPLFAALTAVTLLLALAVTNVATLTVSLMRRRQDELAMRRALGATDRRLFQQLFAQGLLVGALGTIAGLIAAFPGVRVLVLLLPADVPRASSIALDAPVLVAATAMAAAATVLFSTVAATRLRSWNTWPAAALVPRGVVPRRGSGALVATEIALGLALTVMAVLTARSFATLRRVDLGFQPDGVVAARVALPASYDTSERQREAFGMLLDRFRQLPGVASAGLVSTRPFGGQGPATTFFDLAEARPRRAPVADVRYADDGFFAAMRIGFVEGGPFTERPAGSTPEAVVNEMLAHSLWGDRAAVGRRLHVELFGGIAPTVVGVVRDVHLIDSRSAPRPTIYLSTARFTDTARDVIVRATGDPAAIVPSLRAALASMDRTVPLYKIESMPATVDGALASDRFATYLLGGFAVVALMLAAVGIGGVSASDAAARRREVGIRLALGASRAGILALFLRRAAAAGAIGVVIGTGLAWFLTRSMSSILYAVSPDDSQTLAGAAAIVLAWSAGATVLPAWQMLRRSPLSALREQ